MARVGRQLAAIVLAFFCATLACSLQQEPIGTSTNAYSTCGGYNLYSSSDTTHTFSHGVGVLVPSSLTVTSGTWSGRVGSNLLFTTSNDTIECDYNQSDTNTSSQPIAFFGCFSWNTGNTVGGPGTPLTVTQVEFYTNCTLPWCGGTPTLLAGLTYVEPTLTNTCQTISSCIPTADGPSLVTTNLSNTTACSTDLCHASGLCDGAGSCVPGQALPIDDGNACTSDSCDPNIGLTHTFNAGACPAPTGLTCTSNSNCPTNNVCDQATHLCSTDPTLPTNFAAASSFLYTNNTNIDATRVAVVRGRVITRDGSNTVVPGITVSVLGHPEFGSVQTRNDGWYDIAVNGGTTYALQFVCAEPYCTTTPPYVTVHRQATTRWLDYTILDDIAVVQKDTSTSVTPDNATAWQVVRGSPASDVDGTRQATLLIPPLTHATNLTASSYTTRLTETTSGGAATNGPAAMPADLPGQSGYTYAVEMSIDEADTAGLTSVSFNNTLLFYLENFISLPLSDAGPSVPSGTFDREAGVWLADTDVDGGVRSGLALQIIGTATDIEGRTAATLSVDGSTEMNYSTVNPPILDGEREQLATIYSTGQQLWRMPTDHFSTHDYNLSNTFPASAIIPPEAKPYSNTPPQDSVTACGSVIDCEGQVLGESIPIAGTPFSLHYRSETQNGFRPAITIPVTDARPVPCQLDHVDVTIDAAGRRSTYVVKSSLFQQPPPPNATLEWTWDRTDAYGRPVQGTITAHVTIGYAYNLNYNPNCTERNVMMTPAFGTFGSGTEIAHRDRYSKVQAGYDVQIGSFDALAQGLGGWTLSPHHVYEQQTGTIWRGDGGKQIPRARPDTISTVATISTPLGAVAAGVDGAIYVARRTSNDAVMKVSGNTLTAITGPTTSGFAFSDGAAANTIYVQPSGMTAAPDGSLLITDEYERRVIRITNPSGSTPQLFLVAGQRSTPNGTTYAADGSIAAGTPICVPRDVGILPDSTVVWEDDCSGIFNGVLIRRVNSAGKIETVAGSRTGAHISTACETTFCVATQQPIPHPGYIAVGPDSSIYFTDLGDGVGNPSCDIWRVSTDGRLALFGGVNTCGNAKEDGGPALSAQFSYPHAIRTDGNALLITDFDMKVIRRISGDGIIETIAGTGAPSYPTLGIANGAPATSSALSPAAPVSAALAQAVRSPDGYLYTTAQVPTGYAVVRFGAPPAQNAATAGHTLLLSDDGSEVYEFDSDGRHRYTRSNERGAALYTFAYNTDGTLKSVTDVAGNVVNLTYNGSSITINATHNATELTTLTLNTSNHNYLSQVTDANNANSTSVSMGSTGLLASFTPPNGGTHTFSFSGNGLLTGDANPNNAPSGTRLVATTTQNQRIVDVITAEGRDTKHVIAYPDGSSSWLTNSGARLTETRAHTDPVGLITLDRRYDDSSTNVTYPDQSTLNTTYTSDPRFGFAAPRIASSTLVTGSSTNTKTISASATYGTPTLSNTLDPTSLTNEVDSYTLAGHIFTRTFNAQSSPATVTLASPLGRQVVLSLDTSDRVTNLHVAGNVPGLSQTLNDVVVQYDSERLGSVTQGTHTITNHFGATTGFLTSIVSSARGTTSFSNVNGSNVDNLGRPLTITPPGLSNVLLSYDANGNVASVQLPKGASNTHTLSYDAVDNLGTYNPPSASPSGSTYYGYGLDNLLSYAQTPSGVRYRTYDSAGRLSSEGYPNPVGGNGIATNWTYSTTGTQAGHVATISNADSTLTYTYDGLMQTAERFQVQGYSGFDFTVNKAYATYPPLALAARDIGGAAKFTYCYDNDGLLLGVAVGTATCNGGPTYQLSRGANGMLSAATVGSITETYQYDAYGALTDFKALSGATTIYENAYTRNLNPSAGDERVHVKADNILGNTCTSTYGYDSANRIYSVSATGWGCPSSSTYTYDGDGNLNGLNYDNQDRLTTGNGCTWSYTSNGSVSIKTCGSTVVTYGYDVRGNLRHFTRNDAPYARTYDFKVDGRNRRLARMLNSTPDRGWLYDGHRIIGEVDYSNGTAHVVSHFAYVTKPNVPDLMLRLEQGNWVLYRILSDQLGSPKVLVRSDGVAVEDYVYADVWGGYNGTSVYQPFGFAGGLWEQYMGSYHFDARDYDPWQRKWFSADPSRFSGGLSLYAYCANDPINCRDSSGRGSIAAFGTFMAAAGWAGLRGAAVFVPIIAVPVLIAATIVETERMDEEASQDVLMAAQTEPDDAVDAGTDDQSGAKADDPEGGEETQECPKEPGVRKGKRGRFSDPEEIKDQLDSITKQRDFDRSHGRPSRIHHAYPES